MRCSRKRFGKYVARSANMQPEAFSRPLHVIKTGVSMKQQFLEHAVFWKTPRVPNSPNWYTKLRARHRVWWYPYKHMPRCMYSALCYKQRGDDATLLSLAWRYLSRYKQQLTNLCESPREISRVRGLISCDSFRYGALPLRHMQAVLYRSMDQHSIQKSKRPASRV